MILFYTKEIGFEKMLVPESSIKLISLSEKKVYLNDSEEGVEYVSLHQAEIVNKPKGRKRKIRK